MRKWTEKLEKNMRKIDVIGYFKLIRFLTTNYNDEEVTSEELLAKVQRFEDVMAIRYLYPRTELTHISEDKSEVPDMIVRTMKVYNELKRMSTIFKDELPIQEVLNNGLVNKKYLTREVSINVERGMVVNITHELVLVNGLARFYLIAKHFDFDPAVAEKFSVLLQDNYAPLQLESYLKDKIGYTFNFNDDCWGTAIGTNLSAVFYYSPTQPMNPVMVVPLYGTGNGNTLNIFNRDEDFGEYRRIIEVMYGVNMEMLSPQRQLNYRASKSYMNAPTSDIDNMVTNFKRLGMHRDHVNSDIQLERGGEVGLNLIFNQVLNTLSRKPVISPEVLREYETYYIYRNSYRYIVEAMETGELKEALSKYCQSQLRRLYYIFSSYIENRKGETNDDINLIAETFNMDTVWEAEDTLVDIFNLEGLGYWVVYNYLKNENMPLKLRTAEMRKILVVLNTLTYHPVIYYELIKHHIGADKVEPTEVRLDGKYTLELTGTSGIHEIESHNIGVYLPMKNEIRYTGPEDVDSAMVQRVMPGVVRSSLYDEVAAETVLVRELTDIVLINPLTAGCYIFSLITEEFNNMYFKHSESLQIEHRTEDTMRVTLSGRVFEFNLDEKERVQVMKLVSDVKMMNSAGVGFKSNLFVGDY